MHRRPTLLNLHHALAFCIAIGLATLGCNSSGASTPSFAESSAIQASAGSSHRAAARVSWSGTQRVPITDPQMGINVATIDIPTGWKFVGRIVTPPGCHSVADAMDFTALGQDGVTAIIVLPGVRWTVTPANNRMSQMNAQKCPPINITTPSSFLVNIAVPNMHPGAKVESVLPPLPEGKASLATQLQQMHQQSAHLPPQFRPTDQTLDGARVRIQYVRNGQPIEEQLSVVMLCQQFQQLGKTCSTRGLNVIRAPKGQLDAVLAQPALKSMPKSMQMNPEWGQRKSQQQQAIYQQSIDANNRQFEQNQRAIDANNRQFEQRQRANQQQFNQMIANGQAQNAQRAQGTANAMAADRANQAAIDQSAHNTVNYSLDRRDYVDPSTGQTITASSEYNHQWINSNNDTLVQTNDPNFDPNGSINPISESWTELVPK